MSGIDDFRFKSHQLLIELDAATSKMMMMVSAKEVVGAAWEAATLRHHDAFEAWNSFLNSPENPLDESVNQIH
ncbi:MULTISPECIES: hypothetical protein [Pseudomonas]|uniref:hypothetical protein n=1 Tax=Pseudomonas TaxID=286 RepID=UPI00054BD5DD|nr:hypothetical protein [Pseudomonas sp. FDAARGOS_380]ATN11740.1 hypothetical protein CRN80_19775 [Pseudomonas sp. FDAARGOS_380]